MTKFQDVRQLSALFRLYQIFCFGVRFSVSTKEFLWDSSFNANLIFFRVSGHLNLTKIAIIRSEKAGLRGGVLDAQGENQGSET